MEGTRAMKIGYARVSTMEQNLDSQIRQLEDAGCEIIFEEKVREPEKNGSRLQARPTCPLHETSHGNR